MPNLTHSIKYQLWRPGGSCHRQRPLRPCPLLDAAPLSSLALYPAELHGLPGVCPRRRRESLCFVRQSGASRSLHHHDCLEGSCAWLTLVIAGLSVVVAEKTNCLVVKQDLLSMCYNIIYIRYLLVELLLSLLHFPLLHSYYERYLHNSFLQFVSYI